MPKGIGCPIIHLNGDSAETLGYLYLAAYRSLNEAEDRLSKCCPNPRNYYPLGDDSYNEALKHHRDCMSQIRKMIEDLDLKMEYVAAFEK